MIGLLSKLRLSSADTVRLPSRVSVERIGDTNGRVRGWSLLELKPNGSAACTLHFSSCHLIHIKIPTRDTIDAIVSLKFTSYIGEGSLFILHSDRGNDSKISLKNGNG